MFIKLLTLDDPQLAISLKRVFYITALLLLLMGLFLAPPMKQDYAMFWSISQFALDGVPQYAYDDIKLSEAYSRVQHLTELYPIYWFYPPYALLLNLPLALLNYKLSWVVFVVATSWLLTLVICRINHTPIVLWVTLASPALVCNTLGAQNGALNAALAGAGLYYLRRNPALAGFCLGLLAYKPHLALLFFLLLLVDRHWKALAASLSTLTATSGITTLLYGTGIWEVWWKAIHVSTFGIGKKIVPYEKMASVFSAARSWGLSPEVCLAIHSLVALVALAIIAKLWVQKNADFELKAASLAFATLIITPYLFFYDYVLSLIGLAFWASYALRKGWRPWEYELMIIIWFLPLWLLVNTVIIAIPLPSVILITALTLLLRRASAANPDGV